MQRKSGVVVTMVTVVLWYSLGLRLASVPGLPRLNYAHAYAANIRRTGKAWAETSREGRRGINVLQMFSAYACA